MGRPFIFILSGFVLVLLAAFLLVDTVPPRSLTATRMFAAKRRILQFARLHNKLPSSLAELPALPGYDTETNDAWKRTLDYSTDASGVVTLRSLGADQSPGGEGDNRDMTGVFDTRDRQGHWQDDLALWKLDPIRP